MHVFEKTEFHFVHFPIFGYCPYRVEPKLTPAQLDPAERTGDSHQKPGQTSSVLGFNNKGDEFQ